MATSMQDHGDLGPLQAEHTRASRRSMGVIVLLALGGVLALLAGLLFGRTGQRSGALYLSIFGALLLALGIVVLLVAIRQRDLTVRIYEQGLVEARRGSERVVPWEEIEAVGEAHLPRRRMGFPAGTTHICTLALVDGACLQYSDAQLTGVQALCDAIEAHTLKTMMPQAIHGLRTGKDLTFGAVTVGRGGLSNGRVTLPWSELEGIQRKGLWIQVLRDGEWEDFIMTTFATNPHVLIEIACHAVGRG